jgi:outer membrane protein assembly factor BamB
MRLSSLTLRHALCVAMLAALAACSKKEKEIDPPAELSDFPASLRVQRAWGAGVGGDAEVLRLGLGLATDDGRVFAAGRGGDVVAYQVDSGRQLWRARTRVPLAGGTGVGHGLVVVGSSEGTVVALNAEDGKERWRVQVNGEVLAAPAVAPRAVIVRTVDGKLRGLSHDSGKELWLYQQQVPRLSLRGTSVPVIAGNAVICGFDNGKVAALNAANGDLLWETTVALARGRTELERLVDIDSAVQVRDDYVYAVGFQGRAAMLAMDTGQIWWAQEASSYRGLAVDESRVYISTAAGDVIALTRETGSEIWRQSALAHRGLSAPAVTENAVVVADFQGYVHWLDKETGALAGRAQAGGHRVSTRPVVAGEQVLVINDEGQISAFRATPVALARAERGPASRSSEAGEASAAMSSPSPANANE